jgi:hypothetical protein
VCYALIYSENELTIGGTEGAKDGDNHPRKVLEGLLKEVGLLLDLVR